VVGINGQWPCPPLVANVGDTIKINVNNTLGNQTTAIHFHGLFQTNTTFEDGPAMVTQCPIPPGQVFVYEFTLLQSGTYWYHAHVGGQYIDGLRGPLIIRDNNALANYGNIDKEVTLTLTDWYHVEAPYLINYFLSANNTSGAEPVPHTALINEAQNVPITMTPGKLYMFHIVNMGAVAGQYLQFDQHTMTIIEADGVYTQPMQVDQLFVGVAQRYTVLVQAKSSATQNFAIVSQFLTDMFESSNTPPGQQPTCTGWLVYNPSAPMPAPFTLTPQPWDDSQLVPWDQTPMYDSNNVQYIYLTADFGTNSWGGTRAMFNGVTYLPQKVPTFFSALSAPSQYLMNPQIYGQVNPQILPYNAVIELNVNNHDSRAHPFHLHGHNFQLINRAGNEPMWPGTYSTAPAPMRRDTIIIYPGTGATIRFVANNPGIQLFHCHTEWHVETGLTATFIEAPDVMIARKPYIPNSHKTVCDVQKIPRTGNAGGNSKNWLDLSNSNTESSPTYYGALINPPATNPYQGGPA
jgi:iron transport multicopper oxidase